MKVALRPALIIALLCAAAGAVRLPAQQPGGDPPARLLAIDAVALDGRNNPVLDLTQDEIEVWIGGFRLPIEAFEAVMPGSGGDDGRSIVLLLDDLLLPPQLVPRARDVAKHLVRRMGPGDEMAIVLLNGGGVDSTTDRARLLRTLDRYHARAAPVMRLDTIGEHVLKTVDGIARGLAEAPGRRGAIVAIGVSWAFDRPIPPPSVARELREEWTSAMRQLAIARASLYVIEPAGVGMVPPGGGEGGFAAATGGHAFVNTNDLEGAADRILREMRNYYLIAVTDPPVQRTADLRKLEVRTSRRGVTMRAREFVPGR